MINVNDEIKQAYDKSTTQIDKILVNGNEYRISNVEYYDDVYNEGNIFGTAISRCLEFEIQNTIDLEKTEIEYFTGILINTTIQWISLGKFIIQSVEPNDTTQINKVTAMDYMIKSNTIYTSNLDYSSGKITLLQVLQEACNNSNLELATFDFANKDFIVDSNQFDEGTLNRQVIQAIAQLSGTVAKIRTDNKLYLINPNNDLEVSKIFNLNNYKEAEIKRNTHPLNVVSLGMADVEGENITLRDEESVIKNGENILVINDNPFAYTQAKREQLITALFDVVKGFEYTSYYFECQGLPYLETLDKIQFKDKKGNIYNSYIFRFNYKSPNGLESSIEAPSITKATVNYQNVPSALDIAKRAELKVDKANQTITFIVEEQTTQSNRITNVEKETNTVASNLNTFINETYSNDMSNLQDQIDGAIQFWNGEAIPTLSNYPANEWTTEEQRNNHRADIYTVIQDVDGEMKQGKSYRFDKVGNTWQWVELTDNELSAVQALASSKAKVYVTTPTVPYNVGDLWLKDEELYECITSKDTTGSYSASDWVKATKYTDDTKANEVADGLAKTNTKVSTIEQNLDGITERVEATETGIQENIQSINELENEILLTDTFERQKDFQIDAAENILTDVKVYGELEQETRSGKNLLHINNTSSLNGVIFTNNENGTITINGTATASGDLWIANGYSYLADTYKRSFSKGEKFTQSRNIISGTHSGNWYMRTITYDTDNKVAHWGDIVNDMTYTTAYNGETRGVELYISSGATFNNLILFPQLEIGDTATTPEEYGKMPSPNYPSKIKVISRINYENIGKNILPNSATTITSNGLTFTVNSDGSITITGTSTARTLFNINSTKRIKLQQYKYTLSKFGDINNLIETYLRKGSVSQLLASIAATNSKITFTNNYTDEVFVYIAINSGVTINETISIQLETGTEQTEYEPYKEIVETIVLPENEFMGKIDTYEDYIEGNILHKRIGKVVLGETTDINWYLYTTNVFDGYIAFSTWNIPVKSDGDKINIACNYFETINQGYIKPSENISKFGTGIYIRILSSRLKTQDAAGFNQYIKEMYDAGTPIEIYYVLAEEYTKQIDRYTLPTMKGINNISVSAPLSATYYTNVDINSALTSKAEYAEQVIKVDEISTRVSSTETTIANQSVDISSINDNIGSLNNSVNANQQEIIVIKEDYTDLRQTVEGFDFTVVDRIQQQIANGEITSNVVKTTTVAIDADGVKVAKSGSEMQSLLDNEGVYVNKGAIDKTEAKNNTLTVDKDGIVANNLWVRTYLTAGYHRTEGYIENGKKRTGVFYQGGADD